MLVKMGHLPPFWCNKKLLLTKKTMPFAEDTESEAVDETASDDDDGNDLDPNPTKWYKARRLEEV